jgi:hypothetical protein
MSNCPSPKCCASPKFHPAQKEPGNQNSLVFSCAVFDRESRSAITGHNETNNAGSAGTLVLSAILGYFEN